MADEEVILNVDASAAGAGVNQFLTAMQGLATGLDSVFSRLADPKALGGTDLFAERGQQISQSFLRGAQAGLAGFPQFAGKSFGESVLGSIGITPAQTREYQRTVSELNRLRSEMARVSDPIVSKRQYDRRELLGLPSTATVDEASAAYKRFERAVTDAQKNLQRLQNLTKSPTGEISDRKWLTGSAKEGMAWSEDARKFAQRMTFDLPPVPMTPSGAPSEVQARNVLQAAYNKSLITQREQIRVLEEQRDMIRQAPLLQPKPETVQKALTPEPQARPAARVPTPSEWAVIDSASQAPRASTADIARSTGLYEGFVGKVQQAWSEEIRAIQQEIAAREDLIRSTERLHRQNMASRSEEWTARPPTLFERRGIAVGEAIAPWERRQTHGLPADTSLLVQYARRTSENVLERDPQAAWREELDRRLAHLGGPRPTGSVPAADAQWWERAAARGELGRQGFRQQFMSGFGQGEEGERPFAEMVGQTARIALFYGVAYRALTVLQDAIAAIVTETLAYEAALTDLSIATGRSNEQNKALASTLSSIAATAAFSPSTGVELGTRSIGLYGVASASQQEQERVATISAEVSSRVARVSGADPMAVQTQLSGALRAFGYGIDRLPQLEDMITFISRSTGQAQTEILGATANIATLGKSSGFSPEQLMAITAQVGSMTGQNPEATAGQFRQVLSREFAAVAQGARGIGVDTEGMTNVEQIFDAVSKMELSQQQINDFTASFGKGGSQQVAMITLQNWEQIQNLAQGALSATGMGQEAFARTMDNIGKKLQQLGSEFLQFGLKLVETGILDWLVLVVVAAQNVVAAGTALLDAFNSLPRPMRAAALALLELYAAAQLIGRTNLGPRYQAAATAVRGVLSTDVGRFATRAKDVVQTPRTAAGLAAIALRDTFLLSDARRTAATRLAGQASGFGRVIPGLMGYTGLSGAGLLGAGALAAGAAYTGTRWYQNTQRQGEMMSDLRAQAYSAETADGLRDAAQAARNAASEIDKMSTPEMGDLMGLLPALLTRMSSGGAFKEANDLADYSEERATRLDELQAQAEARRGSAAFQDFSAEGIATTLADLEARGIGAADRLAMLNDALFAFSGAASGARDAVALIDDARAGELANTVGLGAVSAAQQSQQSLAIIAEMAAMEANNLQTPTGQIVPNWAVPVIGWASSLIGNTPWSESTRTRRAAQDSRLTADETKEMEKAVVDEMNKGLDEWARDGIISDSESKALVERATRAAREAMPEGKWEALGEEGQREFATALERQIRRGLAALSGKLTPESMSGFLTNLPAIAEATAGEAVAFTGSSRYGDQVNLNTLVQGRSAVLDMAKRDKVPLTDEDMLRLREIDLAIIQAKRQIASNRVQAINEMVAYRQSGLADEDVFGQIAIARGGLEERKKIASQGVAQQALENFKRVQRGEAEVPLDNSEVLSVMREEQELAKRERREALTIAQNRNALQYSPASAVGQAVAGRDSLNLAMKDLASQGLNADNSAAYGSLLLQRRQADLSVAQAVTQRDNANRLSRVDPRNTLARIQTEITNTQAEMKNMAGNERGAALDRLNQLRLQYAEAVVSQANAADQAAIAGNRSPIVQAQYALIAAQRTLSTQLAGTEGYSNALGNLRKAQMDLADAERAQADTLRRLGSDITDPVEQAILDTQRAREQLASDRAQGQGSDIIAQSALDVRSAEAAEERAAFDQRISDIQTAEDLGRITHTQYMSYLQSEHNRLSAIGDRTRQQQEQLDRVDQLMKSAAEQMQGQFNIGDIDLPTIYEVRRAIGAGSATQVADYSNSNNVVHINGAPLDQVLEYLRTYLGAGAQVVTASTGGKY